MTSKAAVRSDGARRLDCRGSLDDPVSVKTDATLTLAGVTTIRFRHQGLGGERRLQVVDGTLFRCRKRNSDKRNLLQDVLGIDQFHVGHHIEIGVVIWLMRRADDVEHARTRPVAERRADVGDHS